MSSNILPIKNVYNNVLNMIAYRKHKLVTAELTDDKLVNLSKSFEYMVIESLSPDTQKYIYIIVFIDSTIPAKSAEFKKMINSLGAAITSSVNLMVITHIPLTTHVIRKVNEIRDEHPNIYLEHHIYDIFYTNIPAHNLVPHHEIATKEEIDEYCKYIKNVPSSFPKILITDPMAVWLGARANDVIKVVRASEITGTHTIYRICVC